MDVGINIAALHNEYGHDLCYNQFSRRQFWSDDKDVWQNYDFTKPDLDFEQLNPWITWEGNNLDNSIKKYKDIVDIIRVWIFEQHEGLQFNFDNNTNCNIVNGLDRDQLIPNIKRVLDKANSYGIKVYLCLTDAGAINTTFTPKNYNGIKLDKYRELQYTRRSIMKEIVERPNPYIEEALVPLISAIKNNPALYAIDLMNEPEVMYVNINDQVVYPQSMINFLIQCSNSIKNISDSIPVSAGSQRYDSLDYYSRTLPKNTLDLYDLHFYPSSIDEMIKTLIV